MDAINKIHLPLLVAIVSNDVLTSGRNGGGGGGSGGLTPPPNVQESVQILEIWKQMCKF